MKKSLLTLALLALGFAAAAQTLEVQSAAQDMRKGYLTKAKASIDKACANDQTKDDPKAWYYKGLIYCQIGQESKNPKSKYKDLAPDWCEQAYDAALKCKELDKDNEYSETNNTVFSYVGGELCSRATNAYEKLHDFEGCMNMCEEAIKAYGFTGDKKSADFAYYLAGLAAQQLDKKDLVKKYFNVLMRRKTDNAKIYQILFTMYRSEGNDAEAIKVANNFYKFHPENYNSALMMAEAYSISGDEAKKNEMINSALEKVKDNQQAYCALLCAAAKMLEDGQDFAGAEAKYNESLSINANQFEANFGMGSMLNNRAIDKLSTDVPFDDETGLQAKLEEEAKTLFGQAEGYIKAAVAYIDALPAEQQEMQKANLVHCLNALKNIYARQNNIDALRPINARLQSIMQQ